MAVAHLLIHLQINRHVATIRCCISVHLSPPQFVSDAPTRSIYGKSLRKRCGIYPIIFNIHQTFGALLSLSIFFCCSEFHNSRRGRRDRALESVSLSWFFL